MEIETLIKEIKCKIYDYCYVDAEIEINTVTEDGEIYYNCTCYTVNHKLEHYYLYAEDVNKNGTYCITGNGATTLEESLKNTLADISDYIEKQYKFVSYK